MDSPWIRAKLMPDYYGISKATVYRLLADFRSEHPKDTIKNGNILIVRREKFEDWWGKKCD